MRVSHLNGWRAVEAVLRLGGIAEAAAELGVTQAAVAAQIRGLEERLARRLFRRGPGRLEPTAEALEAGARLGPAFAAIAGVQARLSAPPNDNRVSLTTTQTFAETWLPHHMADLYARVGEIDLRIEASWAVVDLAGSDFDFAIRYMGPPGDGYESRTLFASGVVPVCTAEFAARYGLGEDRRDLEGVPIVHTHVATTDPDWMDWDGWSERTGIALPARAGATSVAVPGSGTRLARSGMGLVLGGISEVLHAVAEGRIVVPFGRRSVVPGSYRHRLIWLEGRRLGPVQRAVRDWIDDRAEHDRGLMREVFGI